jgi:hypothetical protein
MSNAAATLQVSNYPSGQTSTLGPSWQLVSGTVVLTAGNYIANGLPLTWNPMTSASGGSFLPASSLQTTPSIVYFQSITGAGYLYAWDSVHGTLRIQECAGSAGPAVDITSGSALPAGVTGDTIQFLAVFTSKA